MARELLILRGHPVIGLSPAAIITRALHTTSDFDFGAGFIDWRGWYANEGA